MWFDRTSRENNRVGRPVGDWARTGLRSRNRDVFRKL